MEVPLQVRRARFSTLVWLRPNLNLNHKRPSPSLLLPSCSISSFLSHYRATSDSSCQPWGIFHPLSVYAGALPAFPNLHMFHTNDYLALQLFGPFYRTHSYSLLVSIHALVLLYSSFLLSSLLSSRPRFLPISTPEWHFRSSSSLPLPLAVS